MNLWQYILAQLNTNKRLVLMCVLESKGSSPGRHGFKMVVGPEGSLHGSIGGGIMEHKMVELCRSLLAKDEMFSPFIKRQIHRSDASEKSGMICSGEQTIAFYCLQKEDIAWINELLHSLSKDSKGILRLTDEKATFQTGTTQGTLLSISSDSHWDYQEPLGYEYSIYILGGGHVGLALSSIMKDMGFYVVVLDDRDSLNTMQENVHAHKREVVDYTKIAEYIPEGDKTYVVLVSFGYRTDKEIIKKLIHKKYKYLGMMGSAEKVKTLFHDLAQEGIAPEQLAKVKSPIGIQVNSKTPIEIAVSIAAEIIAVKNKVIK